MNIGSTINWDEYDFKVFTWGEIKKMIINFENNHWDVTKNIYPFGTIDYVINYELAIKFYFIASSVFN